MKRYNPKEIEPKWQDKWAEDKVYEAHEEPGRSKRYVTAMFPYPSGAGLHVGHVRNYSITDAIARFQRQNGQNVLTTIGWDGFGLPAENYAIKTGTPPAVSTAQNIENFKAQLSRLGMSYDWSRELNTTDPSYYKWTQYLFLKLFEQDLAYQKESLQWWCPHDKTVLANEQVEGGRCWRCGHEVIKKSMKQWFFRITEYADALLDGIEDLDWPEKIKTMQRNWIGKSKGAEIEFVLGENHEVKDSLKFTPELTELVQKGEKTVMFRAEPKKLQVGDYVKLITRFSSEETRAFGIGKITETKTQKLRDIPLDYQGHESFSSQDEQLAAYRKYYGADVRLDTEMYIYHFEKVNDIITVFTTRPDTLFGATFLVLAPEHPLVEKLATADRKTAVQQYKDEAVKKSEIQRQENKEKTGEFTGAYAINPANGEKLPIWTADYVLMGYGTGAIMAVPGHDERDYEFARAFDLPVKFVVEPTFGEPQGDDIQSEKIYAILRNPKTNQAVVLDWGPRQKNYGGSMLIGGTVEDGEDHVTTAEREIREETGYTNFKLVKEAEFKGHGYFYSNTKHANYHASGKGFLYDLVDETRDDDQLDEGEKDKFTVTWQPVEKIAAMLDDGTHEAMYRYLVLGECYHGEGVMVNSGPYDGMSSSDAREKIVADLEKQQVASEQTNYKMRDWLISRQRYWGAPIPIIHCPVDGAVAVPEDQLPVLLPKVENYEPDGSGKSVLAKVDEWVSVDCPKCGGPAKRETDTMDGYVDSSWYIFRYADAHNADAPWDPAKVNYWAPLDFYCGGDHAVAHLLYVRFWTRVFEKMGLVDFKEPVKRLVYNGYIYASDGTKMSKSKGNVVDPLEVVDSGYGADALRTYELFCGPYEQDTTWDPGGVAGTFRFLQRVWALTQEHVEAEKSDNQSEAVTKALHRVIKKVSEDLNRLSFNTAIAALMELTNDLYKLKVEVPLGSAVWTDTLTCLAQLVAPFAPHIAEELWHDLGNTGSVHTTMWPFYDEQYLVESNVTIAVQVNGKLRGTVSAPAGSDEAAATALAKADAKIAANLEGREIVKTIYVAGKLLNFVIK